MKVNNGFVFIPYSFGQHDNLLSIINIAGSDNYYADSGPEATEIPTETSNNFTASDVCRSSQGF